MADIYNSFFQDHLGATYFYYTGKVNVLGIQHPDSSILNDRGYKYTRIAVITYSLPDSTSEACIDESFTIAIENDTSEGYTNSIINRVHVFGIVKGNRVVKSTFRCTCEPVFSNLDILDVRLAEETKVTDGISTYCLGIWVKTENCNKIFVTLDSSHSVNSIPMNEYCFSSLYETSLLKENSKVVDEDVTNLDSYISSLAFCTGKNIYESMLSRITTLESEAKYNFSNASVTYDPGFVPITTGDDALLEQIITPTNISYGTGMSPFLTLNTALQLFSVKEQGSYLLQLNSKFTGTPGSIRITLTVNNNVMSELVYDPSYGISSLSAPLVVLNLQDTDLIRVKFSFNGPIIDGLVNDGTTLTVIRLL